MGGIRRFFIRLSKSLVMTTGTAIFAYICIFISEASTFKYTRVNCSNTTEIYVTLLKAAFGSVQEHFSLSETLMTLFLLSLCSFFISLPFFSLLASVIYAINLYIQTF